jgi:hypothetical protein
MKSLEVDYNFNKKAWMTSDIFEQWLLKLDKSISKQHRKIALIVDNCPAHPHNLQPKLKSINLVFFPPNMTSKLQPMDQGIIKNIKCHYRKRILKKFIREIDKNQHVDKISINLYECISILAKVWTYDVTEKTIRHCFSTAGFSSDSVGWDEEDELQLSELKKEWARLRDCNQISEGIELEDYLEIDKEVEIAEYPTDADILDSVTNGDNAVIENEEDDENETDSVVKPSEDNMLSAFETIRRGLQFCENVPDNIFESLNKCESFYEHQTFFKCSVQRKITDFM